MNDNIVVVVYDDPTILDPLRLLLESVGLRAVGYRTAAEFLERQDLDKIGCLILDVRMPGMSGLDLLKLLRRRGVDVSALVVSG